MKRTAIAFSAILVMTLVSALFGQSFYEVHGPVSIIDDGAWVEARVDISYGFFGIGKYTPPVELTWDFFPVVSGVGNSHFIVRIDGSSTFGLGYPGSEGAFSPPLTSMLAPYQADGFPRVLATSNTIQNRWILDIFGDELVVTQSFQPDSVDSLGVVRIRYLIQNNGSVAHTVALEHKYDVNINGVDDAPLAVPGGWDPVNTVIEGIMPGIFLAAEDGFDDDEFGYVARGIINQHLATKPDLLAYGQEEDLLVSNFSIDSTFAGGSYTLSGALLRWNDVLVSPGNSREITTYYGLGDAAIAPGELQVTYIANDWTITDCDYSNNPNSFQFRVQNASTEAAVFDTVWVELVYDDIMVDWITTPPYMETLDTMFLDMATGEYVDVAWLFEARGDTCGEFPIRFQASTNVFGVDPVMIDTFSIQIPCYDELSPTAEFMFPINEYTACTTGMGLILQFEFEDLDIGVRFQSTVTRIRVGEDTLILDEDNIDDVTWSPATNAMIENLTIELDSFDISFSDGDTIEVCILQLEDMHGCSIEVPICRNIYVDTEPPYITNIVPAPGSIISESTPTITFQLHDDIAGVDTASVRFQVNSLPIISISPTGATWDPITGTVSYDLLGGVPSETWVNICLLNASDLTDDICGPNSLTDTCWSFFVDFTAPEITITQPLAGSIISCDSLTESIPLIITANDSTCLDTTAGTVTFTPGPVIDLSTWPYVNWTCDLIEVWGVGLSSGSVDVSVADISDELGNTADVEFLIFNVDTIGPQPDPFSIGHPDGSIVSSFFACSIEVFEESGIADASIEWRFFINGAGPEIYPFSSPHVSYELLSGSRYRIIYNNMGATPLSLSDGDTLTVCLAACDDIAGLCGANPLAGGEVCWTYYIDGSGPSAELIWPADGSCTACNPAAGDGQIQVRLTDMAGIDETSVEFRVDGTPFPAYLVPDADSTVDVYNIIVTFGYSMPVCPDSVEIQLLQASDNLGNSTIDVRWHFKIDTTPPSTDSDTWSPYIGHPMECETVSPYDTIKFCIDPGCCGGFFHDSIKVVLRNHRAGFETIWGHEHPEWWDGDCFQMPIPDITAGDGDSIFINLAYVRDSLDYMVDCGSNVAEDLMSLHPLTYDWGLLISAGGPIISRLQPIKRYVSCENFQFKWRVTDNDGLNDTTAIVHVWSETSGPTVYTWYSPELTFDIDSTGDTCIMTLDVDLSLWAAVGETLCVEVVHFEDAIHVRNEASSTWCIIYDNTDPCPVEYSPEDVGLSTRTPLIWARVPADIAPILPDSLAFSLDGGTTLLYRPAYPTAIYWRGDTAYCDVSELPDTLWPRGGDTVQVCVRNTDNTDTLIGCPLNQCDTCWSFWIEANGPIPTAIEPGEDWIVSCPTLDSLVITLNDSDAIVWDSAWAACSSRVNGLSWEWDATSPDFDGTGHTLKLFLSPSIALEDTYDVWIYAVDELMNPLVSSEGIYHYTFIVDQTPPDSIWFTPNCYGDSVDSPRPTIWLHATDEWGRVDSLSWCLDFWHNSLGTWVEVCYDSITAPAWELYPDSVGLHTGMVDALDPWWRGGDTIRVNLSRVCDWSDLCPPNCTSLMDTCEMLVPSQGPRITNLWPDYNGVLGCVQPDTFIFTLFDGEGVDTSTVRVRYWNCASDTTEFTIGSPEVIFYSVGDSHDTLAFSPPDIVAEGCTLWIEIIARDVFDNDQVEGAFAFVYDYTPPSFEIAYSPIDEVYSFSPRIPLRFPDAIAGVDPTSVYIKVHSWCGDEIDSINHPAPDTLIWTFDSLGRPDTLYFNFNALERCMSTDSTACLTVYRACDDNAACDVCATFDTTWCFTVMQGGPQVDFYHPPSTGTLLCPEDSIVMDLIDPDGINTDSIQVMVNGVVYPYPSPGFLSWDAVDTRLGFYPDTPFDTSEVKVCIWGGMDLLDYEMDSVCAVFNVDLNPPMPTYLTPVTPVPDPQPDITIYVEDEFSPIMPGCFELTVDGTSYPFDDYILTWTPDTATLLSGTLTWSAIATAETLLVGDTIWVCLDEACDSTGCDANNYISDAADSFCWWFLMEAGDGPVVTMENPVSCSLAISCTTGFQIVWHVDDAEGFADYTLDITMFDRVATQHYDMDSPEIEFFGRSDSTTDTLIVLNVPPIDSPGLIWVMINSLEDVLGNPALGIGDTCKFIIDWDSPYTSDHWPGTGEEITTPYPACWWEVQDSSWKVDKNTGHVVVNGTRYDVSMPEVWWTGDGVLDTLWFQPALGDGFTGGDTVVFCIDSVADSTIICDPNWILESCETFFINGDGPLVSLQFPDFGLDPNMVTFCDSGAFWITNIDPERLDSFAVEVIWNDSDTIPWMDAGVPTGYFDFVPGTGDTDYVAIWPPFALGDGDEICLRIPSESWTDTIGNGLIADRYWCALIDLSAPVLVDYFPADDETTDTWTPEIFAYFEDSLAFVGHGCVEFYIEENGAPWNGGTFGEGDPQISWNGDTVFFNPSDDFAEFAEICIDLTICDSTTIGEPMNCPANEITYNWCFTIGDDDTIGPELVIADTCFTFEGNDTFSILVALADENGIYDDATTMDTTGQGLLARFTFYRGAGETEYWLPMEIVDTEESIGVPGDTLYWAMTERGIIPPDSLGAWDSLCYEIWTHDNDFDFDNSDDRQLEISGTFCCRIYDTSPPQLVAIETPDGIFNSCVGEEQGIVVGFFDWGGMIPDSLVISFFGADHAYGSPDVVWEDGYSSTTWEDVPLPTDIDSIMGAFKYVPGLPEGLWENGDVIDVCVTGIYDIWFNQAPDTCWSFISDTEPPLAWCIEATDTNQDIEDFTTVQFGLYDSLAGVMNESIILNIQKINISGATEDFSIPVYDPSMDWDTTGDILTVDLRYVPGYTMERGDSLFFSIYAVDRSVICDPNAVDEYLCVKFIKPITRCYAGPLPFTPPPPADGFNDEVVFDYPDRFDVDATIKIYDMRGRLMIEIGPGPGKIYKWDGYDFNGVPSHPGVYTYVVEVGGEVICSGTVVLAR